MKNYIFAVLFFIALPVCAFDWPQADAVMSDSFYSYFGQLRGETISNSLIFSEPSEIKSAEAGHTAIIISEFNDDTVFFPSALGNAVIISHSDNLMTVYGNIDSDSMPDTDSVSCELEKGTALGISGNSAWQQGRSSLEFQVIDTSNNTSINPRILMPRVGKELPLVLSGVQLQSRAMKMFEMSKNLSLPAGIYRVYQKRQPVALPYKTRISINGVTLDEITYDMLYQDENTLCVLGKKYYPIQLLYPAGDMILLGEISLTPGYNALTVTLSDILGKETQSTFSVNIY